MGTTELHMQQALDNDIARVAFAGVWKNTAAEGMEGILEAFGVGWLKRKAASAVNYYVGKVIDEISFSGATCTVYSHGGSNTRTTTFNFGDQIEVDGPDGNKYSGRTSLENGVWKIVSPKITITREIQGGKIVQRLQSGNAVATRIFEKQ